MSVQNNSSLFEHFYPIDNYVFYTSQVLCFVFASLCVFWLVYVIYDLISRVRIKRRLVILNSLENENDYGNQIFHQRETILRNSIFLVFLCFELIYCFILNIYGFLDIFYPPLIPKVSISPNCTLAPATFLAQTYNNSWHMFVFKFFGWLIRDISFSMLIWMFGASLLHLSYAARNKINVKAILCFSLFGLIINIILTVPILIPYTSLFGRIAQSVVDQISFLLVLYIVNKKFFPAMNSRIIDAFHFNNTAVYLQQKRLLSRYKALIYFLLISFELCILKDLLLYNLCMIF